MKRLLTITALLCALAAPLAAQVPVALAPLAKQQFLSITGAPLASGCLNTYITGTSTPLATYTDGTGTAQNTNPIILDAGGFANIWLSNSSYRFTLTSAGGVNCATGVFQYTVDNVSAYTVINQAQNIFLLGAASDPGGSAGELAYRPDIPCFRGFTTLWDCFVTLTATQTVSNKTVDISANTLKNSANTAGHYPRNNGTQYVDNTIQPGDVAGTGLTIANNIGTPTVLNSLAKLFGPPASVGSTTIADTSGSVGVCISGCGSSGSAVIQQVGLTSCNFDGATTANDYVQISPSIAGNCRDSGGSYPTSGQVIGRVLSSQGVAGTYTMLLFSPEIKIPVTSVPVFAVNLTAQAVNIGATSITTPAANGFYRASCYVVVTQAATTSSTLPSCQIGWTDADSSTAQVTNLTNTNSTNVVGNTGALATTFTPPTFYAKTGVPITYATTGYASVGATPMQYAIHIRLEGPF